MYAASIGKKQVSKTLKIVLGIMVAALVAVVSTGKLKPSEEASLPDGSTDEKRQEYLLGFGIQVDPTSSVAEVKVPDEFDERFVEYNEMLKAQGFDLEPLKGEAVKKCSYTVTNRPEIGSRVTAVLLVKDDRIVAGHIVEETSGTILPLTGVSAGTTEETLLPSVVDEQGEPAGADASPEYEGDEEVYAPTAEDAYPTE